MEDKIKTIEELKELASRSFYVIEPSKNRKGKGMAKISMNNYAEISYYLIDIIKVSIAALDAGHEGVTVVKNVPSAVSGILEKVLDIIPLEEMDFLDKIRDMILPEDMQDK